MSRHSLGLGGPPTPYDPSVSRQPAYQSLRVRHRRFGARATAVAVGGFLLYVLLSSFVPGLMNTSVSGHLTIGLALGLGQFVLMGVIVWRYLVHTRTQVTPVVRGLRGLARHHESAERERAGFETRTALRDAPRDAPRDEEYRPW